MVEKAVTDLTAPSMHKMGYRVAAYIRVSSTEQKIHGLSLPAQKMKLTEYAEKHKLKIVEWYMDEGVSGRKLIRRRPELQRMIRDAEKGMFDRIIFIKLDRFFRSVAEYHECMKRIDPVVWTATEEQYDLTTANGRAFVNMKLTIAELEADQTGERIKIVNDYKVKNSTPVTGNWGFAWEIIKDNDGNKRLVRNHEYETLVYDYLDYYEKHQNLSQAYTYIMHKYDSHLSTSQLRRLLNNHLLYGKYRNNPEYCQPYIDKERFDRIQNILARNVKGNNAKNRAYLFTGLIRCPECGAVLAGNISTQYSGSRKTKNAYKKYCCKNHFTEKRCGFKKMISENVFERLMLDGIQSELDRVKTETYRLEAADSLRDDSDAIIAEIERLNYAWQKGRINPRDYDAKYDALNERLEENRKRATQQTDFSEIEAVLSAGWKEVYGKLSDANKRSFWRSIVKEIHINWTTEVKEITEVIFF